MLAEDAALVREGLAGLLDDRGHEVVGRCGDADTLVRLVGELDPDVVVTDIRMPPDFSDEGARAAVSIRAAHPGVGILLLSQHVETRTAVRLLSTGGGVGYLLKDRVLDVDDFLDALDRVRRGGTALDPVVVTALLRRAGSPLDALTDRERDVLELMADGSSNAAIARRLGMTERTVETHIGSLLLKLGIEGSPDGNRRVRAVLAFLDAQRS